jgi:hypothetical protein
MVNASGFSRFIGCLTVRYLVQMVLDRRVSANQRKRQKIWRPGMSVRARAIVELVAAAISSPLINKQRPSSYRMMRGVREKKLLKTVR